ncbi:hypothetical protein DFH08DRAFT_889187 [Mycena albidolilacea]|uniref:Uncharacterized protein n=1 Tax=Mycena albidolilacea TaxID=1033008 RepID=A0AAD7EG25_9AGAR|nr:hypothetical protein DFH08DRAFT_889187 [Mycena albidolilacea]
MFHVVYQVDASAGCLVFFLLILSPNLNAQWLHRLPLISLGTDLLDGPPFWLGNAAPVSFFPVQKLFGLLGATSAGLTWLRPSRIALSRERGPA